MKKNFQFKVLLLKSKGWKYFNSDEGFPHFYKKVGNRYIDATIVNIMTLEQLSRFLGE